MEPFGEVRQDLRMAKWIQFFYDSKRGRKGKTFSLGEFTMYADLAEEPEPASEAALLRAIKG